MLPTPATAPAEAVRLLAGELLASIAADHPDQASALCSEEFRTQARLSCTRLVTELGKLDAPIGIGDAVTVDTSGVVRLDVRVHGETASIWLRAERRGARWLFVDGVDADEGPARLGVPAAAPGAFATAFMDAAPRGPEALRPLCTAAFRALDEFGCDNFASQASRKAFAFSVYREEAAGDRRVVVLDVLRDGKALDRVWLYVVSELGSERVDSIDESPRHASAFLEGKVPGLIDLDALPEDADLRRLGEALLSTAAGKPGKTPWGDTDMTAWVARIAELSSPTLGRTWRLDGVGTGAICFLPSEGSALNLHAVRDQTGWRIIDYAYGAPRCHVGVDDLMPR
ncbi:MAG: hypothetical protein V4850_25790 [Myxococcota bacterium]